MDRLTNKLLFFGIAFGITGAFWGASLAEPYTAIHSIILMLGHKPMSTQWYSVVVLLIFLFTFFYANRLIGNNFEKSIEITAKTSITLSPLVFLANIIVFMSFKDNIYINIVFYTIVAVSLIAFLVFSFLDIKRMNKKNKEKPKVQIDFDYIKKNYLSILKVAFTFLIIFSLYKAIEYFTNIDDFKINPFTCVVLYGNIAAIDFVRTCFANTAAGALTGMALTVLIITRKESSFTEFYFNLSIGMFAGMGIFAALTVAQITLLINAFKSAFNYDSILSWNTTVLAIAGVIVGFIIGTVVHYIPLYKEADYRKQMSLAVFYSLIPALLMIYWGYGYISKYDVGREIFAKADAAEGHTSLVGLGYVDSESRPRRIPGNRIIRISGKNINIQIDTNESYTETIKACDKLLMKYPESAYRSSAHHLKYICQNMNLQPEEAIQTWNDFKKEYPEENFASGFFSNFIISDYALTGNYKKALEVSNDIANKNYENTTFSNGEYFASVVLAKWDKAIEITKFRLKSAIESNKEFPTVFYHQKLIAKYKNRLKNAEMKKKKGVGPLPRTSIDGSVKINNHPVENIRIAFIHTAAIEKSEVPKSISSFALAGGRFTKTDKNGRYTIADLPSGDYDIVIIMDNPQNPTDDYKVKSSGIPVKAFGKKVTVPTIELSL